MPDGSELQTQITSQIKFLEQELDDCDGHIFLSTQSIQLQELKKQRIRGRLHSLRNSLQVLQISRET